MLDLAQVSQQIASMATAQQLVSEDMRQRLKTAQAHLQLESSRLATFLAKLDRSRTSWLLAEIHEPLDRFYSLPERPPTVTVVATDGSQITPSHHEVMPAFLLNISTIVLHYGTGERAVFSSMPTLFYREDDLYMDYGGERVQVVGDLLGMRRTLMEFQSLVQLAATAQDTGHDTCAMADGSLILWQLEGRPLDYQQAMLQAYRACLEQMHKRQIPVMGYISRSRSRDVLNTLRVGLCPEATPDSDRCPYERDPQPPCAAVVGVTDRTLFEGLLRPGERTQVFTSASRILRHYEAHRIGFCYLHVGSEVVRLEMPIWVATNPTLLDRVHTVAYDQAQKGMGYPVALAEAHQHAVVRGAERDLFYNMVENVLRRRGVRTSLSPKQSRKRIMTV